MRLFPGKSGNAASATANVLGSLGRFRRLCRGITAGEIGVLYFGAHAAAFFGKKPIRRWGGA